MVSFDVVVYPSRLIVSSNGLVCCVNIYIYIYIYIDVIDFPTFYSTTRRMLFGSPAHDIRTPRTQCSNTQLNGLI